MPLPFERAELLELVAKYDYQNDYAELEAGLITSLPVAAGLGFLTKGELVAVAKWKWRGGRTAQLVSLNSDDEIKEVSAASFAAKSPMLQIGALRCLSGVDWPMASVILHFTFPNTSPILDVRALETLGLKPRYNLALWRNYSAQCVAEARRFSVTMRELDKALWQHSKDKSRSRAA